jgi:glycosyltransferase involved in cell wall biosynthesis
MHSVSIALATYNGEAFLLGLLTSLARQTYPISELVVTDDGSTDETLNIISDFAAVAPFRIRIERNDERLGFRANFMKAANLCKSDLIAFCDQDDVWHPGKILAAVEFFDDPDVIFVHHNANVVNAQGLKIGKLHQEGQFTPTMTPNSSDPWVISHGFTQMFRRSLTEFSDLWVNSVDPDRPNSQMAHDQWYFFLAATLGIVRHIDIPLADYRQHGQNSAGWNKEYNILNRMKLWIENRCDVYSRCSMAADRRVSILHEAALKLEGCYKDRAGAAEKLYKLLADLYRLRVDVYKQPRIRDRLKRFKRLLDSNAYDRSGHYTFTRKGMIKDLTLGVLLGPLTAAYGLRPTGGDSTCRRGG